MLDKAQTNHWSIVAAERHLPLGVVSKFLFKQEASHAFLRVKDAEGKVVCEIHGQTYNPRTGEISSFKLDPISLFRTAAYIFGRAPLHGAPSLRIIALTNTEAMRAKAQGKESKEIPIAEGPEDDILRSLECALRASSKINKSDLGYYLFGFKEKGRNCHSALAELVDRMLSIHLKMSDMNYATPGIETDLEPLIVGLDNIKPDFYAPMATIKASIKENLAELDPSAQPDMKWVDAHTPSWQKKFPILVQIADQMTKWVPPRKSHLVVTLPRLSLQPHFA